MASLIVPTGRPILDSIVKLVSAAAHAAAVVNVSMNIVGATARDIIVEYVYGIRIERATADVDVAIAVSSWEKFDELIKEALRNPHFERAPETPNRLRFGNGTAPKIPLDIIPYGDGIGTLTFTWPNDPDIEMNIAGYYEATANAVQVALANKLVVNVLSIPGQVLLKLSAWSDRRKTTTKDALDLALLLSCYIDAGNSERIFADAYDQLEVVEHDLDRAAPYLLGTDLAGILSKDSSKFVNQLISDQILWQELAKDVSRRWPHDDKALSRAEALLQDFRSAMLASSFNN